MSITLVVNTAAMQPEITLSSGKVPHSWRGYALRNWILPAYINNPYIDQLIVSGVWEEGEGYEYVCCPSVNFDCTDALFQRHAGFLKATGDILIFAHDDHFLPEMPDPIGKCMDRDEVYGVISPSRYTRLRKVEGERLFNGEDRFPFSNCPGVPYISGHCGIYRREVIEKCPWNKVDKVFTWDICHTRQIKEAGFKINWTDDIRCWDVENGSEPWK